MPTTTEISTYVTGLASATLTGTEEVYLASDEKTTVKAIASFNGSFKTVTVDMGQWDMDTDASKSVAHGQTLGFIRNVTAIVRNDAGTLYMNLNTAGAVSWDATNVILDRTAAGLFDSTDYDSVAQARGFIQVQYLSV